jgi:hypothetical protein
MDDAMVNLPPETERIGLASDGSRHINPSRPVRRPFFRFSRRCNPPRIALKEADSVPNRRVRLGALAFPPPAARSVCHRRPLDGGRIGLCGQILEVAREGALEQVDGEIDMRPDLSRRTSPVEKIQTRSNMPEGMPEHLPGDLLRLVVHNYEPPFPPLGEGSSLRIHSMARAVVTEELRPERIEVQRVVHLFASKG